MHREGASVPDRGAFAVSNAPREPPRAVTVQRQRCAQRFGSSSSVLPRFGALNTGVVVRGAPPIDAVSMIRVERVGRLDSELPTTNDGGSD
jgi:hypothetical protein